MNSPNNTPSATKEEALRNIFCSHPRTETMCTKTYPYTRFRGIWYALYPEEKLERTLYKNGDLTMILSQAVTTETAQILSLSITDETSWMSSPREITDESDLRYVLGVTDEERAKNTMAA